LNDTICLYKNISMTNSNVVFFIIIILILIFGFYSVNQTLTSTARPPLIVTGQFPQLAPLPKPQPKPQPAPPKEPRTEPPVITYAHQPCPPKEKKPSPPMTLMMNERYTGPAMG
jgi:hypothetical protein